MQSTSSKVWTLGSSRFASAIGVNPYCSRARLWRQMTGREQVDPLNQRMQWGKNNEWLGVLAAEAMLGFVFNDTGDNQVKCERDWLTSTPDGRHGTTGLEVTCPEKPYEDIPPYYMPQIQGQMFVCGLQNVYFGCWTSSQFKLWDVVRNADYWEECEARLEMFKSYLDSDTEPPRLKRKPVLPQVTYAPPQVA